MQLNSAHLAYAEDMVKKAAACRLRELREAARLSQRELARTIGEQQSNIRYWEVSGNLPRSNVLIPLAAALGVTVEELLGEPRPKRVLAPAGRLRQLFEATARLPRNQQQKIADVVEALLDKQTSKAS